MKTILIADPHLNFKNTIEGVLVGFKMVGDAYNATTALESVKKHEPDMVILDSGIIQRAGTQMIRDLKTCHPELKILVAAVNAKEGFMRSVFDGGADGYFLKDEGVSAIRSAISCVLDGKSYGCRPRHHK